MSSFWHRGYPRGGSRRCGYGRANKGIKFKNYKIPRQVHIHAKMENREGGRTSPVRVVVRAKVLVNVGIVYYLHAS